MEFAFNNAVAEDYLAQNLNKFQTRVDEGKIGKIPLEEGDSGFISATEQRYRIDKSASHLTSSGFLNPKCLRDLRGCINSTRLGEILGLVTTEDIQARIDAAVNNREYTQGLKRNFFRTKVSKKFRFLDFDFVRRTKTPPFCP